jgi:sRNA-binding protein
MLTRNKTLTHDNTAASVKMLGWLAPLLDRLPEGVALFPRTPGHPVLPLAIGTAKGLVELGVPADIVADVIRGYTRHPAYLRALARPGAMRHGLDAQPVEPVSEEHARYAVLSLEAIKRRRREENDRRVAAVREAALAAKQAEAEAAAAPVEPIVAEPEPKQAPHTKPILKLGVRLSPAEVERRPRAARSGVRERTIRTSG